MKSFIDKHSTGRKVLILFILTTIVHGTMLLFTMPEAKAFSEGLELLDLKLNGYNLEYVHELFSTLGIQGRDLYLYLQIPVDMFYPGMFALTYCLIMGYFLKRTNKFDTPSFYLCYLPIIGGLTDYVENFGFISMLKTYPDITESTVRFFNTFSMIKMVTVSISLIMIALLIMILALRTREKN